jgi:P4 family phage/plasmid primase-like protien
VKYKNKKNEIEKYQYIISTMSIIMSTTSNYRDLNEFLAKHSAKEENAPDLKCTHTRIPGGELHIRSGSYIIPKEELPLFYSLYHESIFIQNKKEYLTETQLEADGPMAVDFDFRYNHDVFERQHTTEHITDMVCEYLDVLKECYLIEEEKSFDIFIFEKPNVNRLKDGTLTKDGIHMLIGLKVDHTMQMIIRERMLEKLDNIWDLPLINTWDSVLDNGISKGTTNWQLYGSRKPDNEAYELTHHYVIKLDSSDKNFAMDEKNVKNFDLKNNFCKLSVQYDKNPKFEINPKIIDEYNKTFKSYRSPKSKKASSSIKKKLIGNNEEDNEDEDYISINDIIDKESLDRAVNLMLKGFAPAEYEIVETHQFTQALPEKYYQPGSHILNRQVAFALKATDDRLFLSWVQLRSKADDFDYNSIYDLNCQWKKFHRSNQDGIKVTRKSIMYWVKKDNFNEYEKIKKNTIDYYLDDSCKNCGTEYSLAMILRQMYKDKYVCVSYNNRGIWYQFKNHRWVPDKGLNLRSKISEELYTLMHAKYEKLALELLEYPDDEEDKKDKKEKPKPKDPRKTHIQNLIKTIGEINIKLKSSTPKNNILREAAEIFYDDEFVKNIDSNKYLLCFKNGVVDFKNKVFREGYPEDYITKTTNINYIPDLVNCENVSEYQNTIDTINEFMNKLFPIPDLNKYMWNHFASCLIGTNKNQTFHVYHGSGSNGKSIVSDLMSATLGEYKGTVPITLVTEARGKIGGTSDEVLKLKGVRYAVMQEPTKSVKLNEGMMKELTGGDPIQARGLYSESEIFEPQFNLVVCTNNLFDIESNDDGTWRRIRKCDFMSKFIDQGESHTDTTPYIYPKDKSLKEKLPSLAPVFASMLVKLAFENDGNLEMCETIANSSNKYRKGQDHITAFISEKVLKTDNPKEKIKKTELISEFKKWFEESQGSRKIPKGEELYEIMNKKFGQPKSTGWHGIKILYPEEEEDIMDNI